MPEGQSLVLAARRLAPIVGHEVTEGALAGATIEAVEPYGKHLLIRTDDVRRSRTHRLRLGPDVLGDFDPEEYLRRARLVDRRTS